jgi:hypothetical protein
MPSSSVVGFNEGDLEMMDGGLLELLEALPLGRVREIELGDLEYSETMG